MWIITLILVAIVIFIANYWVKCQLNYWKKRGIPYHSSTSPFRAIFQFLFTKKSLLEMTHEDYTKLEGHKFAGFFNLFSPGITIRDADLILRVCIKDFSYFEDRNPPTDISDMFTESLGSLTGDRWRVLRHKLTPTFTSGKLKLMFDMMKENCDEVVEFVNGKLGADVDARDFSFKFGLNVIGSVAFGLKVDALNEAIEKNNEFLNISRRFFKPSFLMMMKFIASLTMPKIRNYLRFSMIDEDVAQFFNKLVKDMITHRENTGEMRNDFLKLMLAHKEKEQAQSLDNSSMNKTNATPIKSYVEEPEDNELLDQLKHMSGENENYNTIKVFTDECIVSQTFMFISAGSETVAASLSFILYELAQNPIYQRKVQEEVDDVISKHGFTYVAIKNMKYLEQFIHESMRLHTVTPIIVRICSKDYKIPDTDVVIDKGTFVAIPVLGINLDPQFFPDPEKFDPDRFEDLNTIHPACLLSFGTGPRMCIAKRLAILEMKMFIATLLRNFTVELSPKTKLPLKMISSSVFLHVKGGIWIQFQKRN